MDQRHVPEFHINDVDDVACPKDLVDAKSEEGTNPNDFGTLKVTNTESEVGSLVSPKVDAKGGKSFSDETLSKSGSSAGEGIDSLA